MNLNISDLIYFVYLFVYFVNMSENFVKLISWIDDCFLNAVRVYFVYFIFWHVGFIDD